MGDGVRIRGCFKFGCFGCLGLAGAAVLVVAALVAVAALNGSREVVPERRASSHPLPGGPPGQVEAPELPDAGATRPVSAPGRVVLDLRAGEFRILPGKPGEPLRVDADFDSSRFELEESFEAAVEGASGWSYHVTFRPRRWIQMGDGLDPEVDLYLPAGAPIALEGSIGMGQSTTELGGLWITSTDLKLGMGEHSVSFAEPLPVPMDRFDVTSSMGELSILSLGNASPAHARVTHRMGALLLDLRGAWARDASVEGRCSMGEFRVRAPQGVHFETDDTSVLLGEKSVAPSRTAEAPPPGAPTVRLSASASLGELRVN